MLSGNELASTESCECLGSGQVYDSNMPTLAALLQLHHIPYTTAGVVRDTPHNLKQGIQQLLDKGTLALTCPLL